MTFDLAIRASEILLAIAFIQQSAEHSQAQKAERRLFAIRFALAALLLWGVQTAWVLLAMMGVSLVILHRFQGPYNGGSDRMGLLVLFCLTLVHFMPAPLLQEAVFGYLALQLIMSYVISGWVKIVNSDWRSGQALEDVFRFSAYPVSENLRRFADRPNLLRSMSWLVMLFELLFPLALLNAWGLLAGLALAALFHLANVVLFGLNRFFWIWLTAYPSLIWLQTRLILPISGG